MRQSLINLNLKDKQTIVDLMEDVVAGNVSCRRASTEIQTRLTRRKPKLNDVDRVVIRARRERGDSPKDIASDYGINPATVWRICKSND